MEDTFGSVDHLSSLVQSDRVNPSDRSSKDKKRNGFSNALKDKMKEKLKQKKKIEDQLILDDEQKENSKSNTEDSSEKEENKQNENSPGENNDIQQPEHIDINA